MKHENVAALTDRQKEILVRLAEGRGNASIACVLECSEETVRTHLHHILVALECTNRTQAVICAYESLLVRPACLEKPGRICTVCGEPEHRMTEHCTGPKVLMRGGIEM